MTPISQLARTLHDVSRLTPALLKTCTAIFLGLLLVSIFVPRGNVVLSQSGTGNFYTAIDLNPPGVVWSEAYGISGGQQVGRGYSVATGGNYHALLWNGSAASVVDLNPGGFTVSGALGTWGGQQVGLGGGTVSHALLWSGSAASVVDLSPGAIAYGISGGQQVGGGNHALLWSGSAASVVDLHPAGFTYSIAYGISGGQQVGRGYSSGSDSHALLWSGSAASVVDLHPAGFTVSEAYGISGGQQVGRGLGPATGGTFFHALLWSGSAASVIDLHPARFASSEARGVSGGQQVGFGQLPIIMGTGNNRHALLWSGSVASVVDLHDFLPAGYSDSEAWGIDAQGNVAGIAYNVSAAANHAILWKKTPIIAIDAGHGRICWPIDSPFVQNQATGTHGVSAYEDDLALAIAQNLALDLRQRGYIVIETRPDQCLLARPDVIVNGDGTRSLDYTDDLRERVLRVAVAKSPVSVFVSVHLNGSRDTTVNGTEVWVDGGTVHSQAEALAMQIAASQACLSPTAQPCTNPALPIRTGGDPSKPGVKYVCCDVPWVAGKTIFVLRGAALAGAVAVLNEFAFLTNSTQETSLLDATYRQQQVVLVISGAIRRYMGTP